MEGAYLIEALLTRAPVGITEDGSSAHNCLPLLPLDCPCFSQIVDASQSPVTSFITTAVNCSILLNVPHTEQA